MIQNIKDFIHKRFAKKGYIIKEGNLYCRPLTQKDRDLIKKIYSDPYCRALLVGDVNPDDQPITEWIGKMINEYDKCGLSFYAVCKKGEKGENEEKVGIVGLGLNPPKTELELPWVSIHYAFPSGSHQKGYCTRICQELVRFAVEELKIESIHAQTLSYNKVSQLILRRLGFQPNGTEICTKSYKDEYVTKFLLTRESYNQASTQEKITIESVLHKDSRYFRDLINKDYKKWYNDRENVESNKVYNKRIINYLNIVSTPGIKREIY
ncbi:GNAT family N-acetyltransferase [Rickettsiales endosymbiont of Stachyamoeba lipophora]|uniref:GNAT family N-acetyltransferase n=1 Tax=Rickettsiales endosymbiont of Stachyamoeba lipophora TaxID=2486578 RepID=UPI000F648202|nr:GNAT family N-acetyltransferase [Rickettsiales endosymbiont of Stachyamoeba lipophora]AZL16386.1 N-acetyltransferase [Rickettsiales endosymbiont of Stachyamoeba lipophora]